MKKFLILVSSVFCCLFIKAQDSGIAPPAIDTTAGQPASDYVTREIEYTKTDTSFLKETDTTAILPPGVNDTSLQNTADSLQPAAIVMNEWLSDSSFRALLKLSPMKSGQTPTNRKEGMVQTASYPDSLFYGLLFLLLLLGVTRTFFPVYVQNIFSLSFQPVFRQVQTKELLTGQSISAVLLNLLFILTGGMLVAILATYYQKITLPFIQLFLAASALLFCIYTIKYLFLRFMGWVFNAGEAAAEYSFIVFLINKVMGIVLLPFLLVLAYADSTWIPVIITAVFCVAAIFFGMRYLVLLTRVRKALPVNAVHFLIYICAVEVLPLLVIYKAVLFPERFSR